MLPTALIPYAGIFVGMLFEGDLLLFGVTFLALTGKLAWWLALPLAIAGALLGDLLWYALGTCISPESRYGKTLRAITRIMDGRIERHPRRMLFLSKITYGLHRPIQLRFGMERFPVKRYFLLDLPATAFWFAAICTLAVVAHITLLPVLHYLRMAEVLLLALLGFFVFLRSGIPAWILQLITGTRPVQDQEDEHWAA